MTKISSEIKVGDIVRVSLTPTVGSETSKARPCLVLEAGGSPLEILIVVPITEDNGKRSSHFFAPIPELRATGLKKRSVVDCYQIRTISTLRVQDTLGAMPNSVIDDVKRRIALILDIRSKHVL